VQDAAEGLKPAGGVGAQQRGLCAACGLIAVLLALTWQYLAVRYNYAGNWTGLFCTGARLTQPPSLASEKIYAFANSSGYDGQFYHYVAHDPLLLRGLDHYIDAPRLRYRRILLPGLAFVAAFGNSRYIDAAFIGVNLLFLFAGVYWMTRYFAHFRWPKAWGLLFLFVPAVIVSLDRLTVDLTLTSLSVGFALYALEDRFSRLYIVLLLAPLARETGLFLTAGYCLAQFSERSVRQAFLSATTALPALGWYAFVGANTGGYSASYWFTPVPLAGLFDRMIHPVPYPLTAAVAWTATVLDELALAGMLLAFVLSFWLLKKKWIKPIQFAIVLFALSGLNLGKPFWEEAYAFGRVFSPLLVLIALGVCPSRSWIPLAPVAMIFPRVGFQIEVQVLRVARGLFG
jgi:hypothetical protein